MYYVMQKYLVSHTLRYAKISVSPALCHTEISVFSWITFCLDM